MFRTPTTIVVGAGASEDYRLPLGSGLRDSIAKLVNISFDDFGRKLESGDYDFVDALRVIAQQRNLRSINGFIAGCRQMAQAMPMALSIDNYLDAHQQDEDIILCGKLAISKAILDAERGSTLWHDHQQTDSFDFSALQGTWISKLVNVLTEGVSKSNVHELFNNITIISFNYDRCIKVFLRQAIKVYYGLNDTEANATLGKLKILHPYGSVGLLPFEGSTGVAFGSDRGGQSLIEVSKGIKTFTERVDDNGLLDEIRLSVQNSENLMFLGFAFHRQNMELISPVGPNNCRTVFATTVGISPSDNAVIETDVTTKIGSKRFPVRFMTTHKKSASLFDEYWRSITA